MRARQASFLRVLASGAASALSFGVWWCSFGWYVSSVNMMSEVTTFPFPSTFPSDAFLGI